MTPHVLQVRIAYRGSLFVFAANAAITHLSCRQYVLYVSLREFQVRGCKSTRQVCMRDFVGLHRGPQ